MVQIAAGSAGPVRVTRPSGLRDGILASRRLRYIYVQNPKCGSSTIRHSLWTAEHALGLAGPPGVPHVYCDDQPFIDDPRRWEHVEDEYVFTFARNPYARVLSAYLNKVVKHRDPLVWGNFAARHGLGDGPLAFGDFLRLVARTPSDELDPHWRPQCELLIPDLIPYDFIGSMETFEVDLRRLMRCIFGPNSEVATHAPHRTDAVEFLTQHYGKEQLELVQRIYQDDFTLLGYSPDPAQQTRVRTPVPPNPDPIRRWGRAWRLAEGLEFADAAAEFEALRAWIAGPLLEERLLRCLCELPNASAKQGLARGVRHLEEALPRGYGDAISWKWYARALTLLGRREDGLMAMIESVRRRQPPAAGTQARLRRLAWQLALVRASKGRRSDALAALGHNPRQGECDISQAQALSLVERSVIRLVASTAVALGARRRDAGPAPGVPEDPDGPRATTSGQKSHSSR
jgi:hypothetical protein